MYSIIVKEARAQAIVGTMIIVEAQFEPGNQESYSAAMAKCSAAINAYNERGL